MNSTVKGAALAVATLAIGGLGVGIASAQQLPGSTITKQAPAAGAEATSPDTDNLQVGDQTSPDSAAGAEATSPDTDNLQVQVGDQTSPDSAAASASESSNEGENADANDGPGGHQDPAGNVQHEGGNSEQ